MKILILCTGNSCRSQMAEALIKFHYPKFNVFSAGTKPATQVHPLAIKVMDEMGLDISNYKPKNVRLFLKETFDCVITVCGDAQENCPVFTGNVQNKIHIGFSDPDAFIGNEIDTLNEFRKIRDQINATFSAYWKK